MWIFFFQGSLNKNVANKLPAGSTGEAAIFTEHVASTHVVRRVMLRMTAFLTYVNPF